MKQREPRHQVAVPARIRASDGWADAMILNLSNRGLMFRSTEGFERGGYLELRRGNHVIIARVMWSDGARHGAKAQGIIPVADIILDNPADRAVDGLGERRAVPRNSAESGDRSRLSGRRLEFFLAGAGVACAAFLVAQATYDTLRDPFAGIQQALDAG